MLTYVRSRTPSLFVLYHGVHVVVLLCTVVLALQQLEVVTVPFFSVSESQIQLESAAQEKKKLWGFCQIQIPRFLPLPRDFGDVVSDEEFVDIYSTCPQSLHVSSCSLSICTLKLMP